MSVLTITAVDNTTEQLTITAHGLNTGDGPGAVFVGNGGVIPGGLAPVTDYWIIRVDANTIKLADSSAHAQSNTPINITSNGTLPLSLQIGIPYRRARTYAAGSQVKSADLDSVQDSLVAVYDLLSGQAQSIFTGITVNGQAVFKARQILTAGSGTYTPTPGARKCLLRWCGGGGAGGSATNNTAAGCGGGSGESCEIWIDPGAVLTGGAFTNGAAGAGGSGNGGNGGDTTIVINGTTYTAKGGLGGTGLSSSSVPAITPGGASQTTGTYPQCTGKQGGPSIIMNNTGNALSGEGGSSLFGAGGAGRQSAGAGNNGTGKGSGGGGAITTTATTNNGGNGTIGVIVIDEYF